jgi:hypothetical protein
MRVVVGLEDCQHVAAVTDALRAAGASWVSAPQPSLPDVVVAEYAGGDPAEVVARFGGIRGVRYAELDQPRFSS